ncbi:uncharacterized protein [Spinacia oleracea]|uniref:RNase H type-1 domain-containing protein n=1 Tax=Spinacia oleracea TaxID=3562 RepID=A0A9R0J9Y5_SPIOL|nr:uncharacterized protein LOC110802790 [Spinacia oleracea]
MSFSRKFNPINPLAAELYAVRERLMVEVDCDIKDLELETNAQSLVTMLGSVDNTYHHELSAVNNDVDCLRTRFSSLVIKHIPRGSKKVVHCLAQYAMSMAVGHKMFMNPPHFTRVAYQDDIDR